MIDRHVKELLDDLRDRLETIGIATQHLDDHQLYVVLTTAVYRLECAGQPIALANLLAVWGMSGRAEVAA